MIFWQYFPTFSLFVRHVFSYWIWHGLSLSCSQLTKVVLCAEHSSWSGAQMGSEVESFQQCQGFCSHSWLICSVQSTESMLNVCRTFICLHLRAQGRTGAGLGHPQAALPPLSREPEQLSLMMQNCSWMMKQGSRQAKRQAATQSNICHLVMAPLQYDVSLIVIQQCLF